jgi:hypothetical protein
MTKKEKVNMETANERQISHEYSWKNHNKKPRKPVAKRVM